MPSEQIIGDYEVIWDGAAVWVNGPDGISRARYRYMAAFGAGHIDVHHDFETQCSTGEQCLDCGRGSFDDFKAKVFIHLGVELPEDCRPTAEQLKTMMPRHQAMLATLTILGGMPLNVGCYPLSAIPAERRERKKQREAAKRKRRRGGRR